MASDSQIEQLQRQIGNLSEFDWKQFTRPDLGVGSIAEEAEPIIDEINDFLELAQVYAPHLHVSTVESISQHIGSIRTALDQHTSLSRGQFIDEKENILNRLRSLADKLALWKPTLAGVAVLDLGLLNLQQLKAASDESAEKHRERLADVAKDFLERASAKAEEIERNARAEATKLQEEASRKHTAANRTATGVSVKEAQEQFREAASHDKRQVTLWASLVAATVTTLILSAMGFLRNIGSTPLQVENIPWHAVIPEALLKVFILSTLAGAATFSFRMLRAYLHIAEKNRHRVRVANSIEGFLAATASESQRDLIHGRLTESIVNHGDSGLIQREREDHSPTMSSDVIARLVAALPGKGS